MKKTTSGFTIVELLIVIVVIAILAAISVVAYTGIQNRANDSAVKSDLNNMAKKIHLAAAETGEFLPGGSASGSITSFPGFTFKPSKEAYSKSQVNLFYCRGFAGGNLAFRISARSKSGNSFTYDSVVGMRELGNVYVGTSCEGLTDSSYSYGYYMDEDRWWPWTD